MFKVHCDDCGHQLRDVNETPCPNCGNLSRTVKLEARSQAMAMAMGSPLVLLNGAAQKASVVLSSLIIPEEKTAEGVLVRSVSTLWVEIVNQLGTDWALAYKIPPDKWEEIVAGAFKKDNYDEVTLTPRSGDHGRDVIAVKRGFGCVKIIGSVKAYAPGNLVAYDDVRALLGVMSGEQNVSKGVITTTSDFPPKITDDPYIKPFLPTRLELVNGKQLLQWLTNLNR